jgi:hypothetical protein
MSKTIRLARFTSSGDGSGSWGPDEYSVYLMDHDSCAVIVEALLEEEIRATRC